MNRLLVLLFCIVLGNVSAQESMQVQRCADIDRRVPINNIFIDENNNKWVADNEGLFLVQSPEFAKTVDIATSKWSLLSAPDGNMELDIDKESLQRLMGNSFANISTAHIAPSKTELWIGTTGGGLFHFKVNPGLELIKNFTSKNSKLRSNNIQTLYIDSTEKLYAGTDDGLFAKKGRKEFLYNKGYDVTAIANFNNNIWVIADGEVLEVDDKGYFYEMDIDTKQLEGELVDIDFDSKGRLWIASEVVTRYNLETEYYDQFGPAEYFTSQLVSCVTIDSDDAAWIGTKDKGVYFIGRTSSLNATIVIKDLLSCESNAKNASLQVRATGGQPPYSFKWDKGLKGENPKGLGPDTYTVTVTDKNGETAKANKTINDPRLDVSVYMVNEASLGRGKDGQAEIKVTGGNNNFTFLWDNGETTKIATKLTAGEHKVTITDKGSCSTTVTVNITEKLAPLSVTLEERNPITCNGTATGAIEAIVNGGEGPYSFKWDNANGKDNKAVDLAAGNYQITISDSKGSTATTTITLNEPDRLTVSVKVKAPATTNNSDGKAVAKGTGGTGKYSYKWDNGEVTDVASKLPSGNRNILITDENGCTANQDFVITEDILSLEVDVITVDKIKCAGDNTAVLTADISGGKPPFTYHWSNNAGSAESANGLVAGEYTLTVTDAKGTTATATHSVKEPKPLTAVVELKAPASTNNSDGTAHVKAEGGTGKYTYRWATNETTATASKLNAGTHTVNVTDENGCSTSAEVNMTENILAMSAQIKQTQKIKCAGENSAALEVMVKGGKPPFKYQWSDASINGEKGNQLAAGEYQLTVTDAAENSTTTKITINEPQPLTVVIEKNIPASSARAKDGRASIAVEGGNSPYSYAWDNGEATDQNRKLTVGNHSVTISDANNCKATAEFETLQKLIPELRAGRMSNGQILQVPLIAFEADSTDVLTSSYPTLNEISVFLQQNPSIKIEVGGHTNNIPEHEFCDRLSKLRAKSVADYIISKGISADRVVYNGYGKRKPKYSNNYKEGRAKNQRVEIKILSL